MADQRAQREASGPKFGDRLSAREKQVIALLPMLNKEIAWELHLTEGTIKQYLNRIFRKTGLPNRTAVAVWALEERRQLAA